MGITRFHLWSRYVASTNRPILVGPWRVETGTEILYHVPWLHAWLHKYQIKPNRVIAISRNGASVWYSAGKAVELTDYWPIDMMRLETQRDQVARKTVKQLEVTQSERLLYPMI